MYYCTSTFYIMVVVIKLVFLLPNDQNNNAPM